MKIFSRDFLKVEKHDKEIYPHKKDTKFHKFLEELNFLQVSKANSSIVYSPSFLKL